MKNQTFLSTVTDMKADQLLKNYAAGVRDFTGVNLSEANLREADLSGVILDRAILDG
ncbi:MAG: pentapeptide repeat-containing protein, partial [Nostoc sp.]